MTGPLNVESLLAYLTTCGGSDTFTMWDAAGQPDLDGARRYAERLRALLGDRLDVVATVEQSFNRVTLSLLLETAKL